MDITKLAEGLFELEDMNYDLLDKQLLFFSIVGSKDSFRVKDFQEILAVFDDNELKDLYNEVDSFPVYDSYEFPESYIGQKVPHLVSEQVFGRLLNHVWDKHTLEKKRVKFF